MDGNGWKIPAFGKEMEKKNESKASFLRQQIIAFHHVQFSLHLCFRSRIAICRSRGCSMPSPSEPSVHSFCTMAPAAS